MFSENITDHARKAMALANECALGVNHEEVRPEHILIGLLRNNQGLGVLALKNLRVDPRNLWLDMERLLRPESAAVIRGKLPLSSSAKLVIKLGEDEAGRLGQSFFGTEHLLVGLIQDKGVTGQNLARFGEILEPARAEIARLLAEEKPRQSVTEAASSDTAGITATLKITRRDQLFVDFQRQVELAEKCANDGAQFAKALFHANLAIAFAAMANNFPDDSK